jgi:hypothetical protein
MQDNWNNPSLGSLVSFHGALQLNIVAISTCQKVCANQEQNNGSSRFLVGNFSEFWQHAGEDFQTEVLLVA